MSRLSGSDLISVQPDQFILKITIIIMTWLKINEKVNYFWKKENWLSCVPLARCCIWCPGHWFRQLRRNGALWICSFTSIFPVKIQQKRKHVRSQWFRQRKLCLTEPAHNSIIKQGLCVCCAECFLEKEELSFFINFVRPLKSKSRLWVDISTRADTHQGGPN